jgi:hypothetical protein
MVSSAVEITDVRLYERGTDRDKPVATGTAQSNGRASSTSSNTAERRHDHDSGAGDDLLRRFAARALTDFPCMNVLISVRQKRYLVWTNVYFQIMRETV